MSRECFVQFEIRLIYNRSQCFLVAMPQTPPDTSLSFCSRKAEDFTKKDPSSNLVSRYSWFPLSFSGILFAPSSFLAADPISTESKSRKRDMWRKMCKGIPSRSHWNWPRIELLIDRLMYDGVFVSFSYGAHFLPFPQNHLANSLTLTLPKTNWMSKNSLFLSKHAKCRRALLVQVTLELKRLAKCTQRSSLSILSVN